MTEQILHEAVSTEIAEPLGVITLGDARRRNPLSTSTMRAITAALRDFDDDPRVRVIVIRALGPAFSAGHDLGELVDRTLDDERAVGLDTVAVHEEDEVVELERGRGGRCRHRVSDHDESVGGRRRQGDAAGARRGRA